jgi:predicted CopG family antitoxin
MTSKNISITEDVYNKLLKIKRDNESFSELFLRLLKIQKNTLEKSFGAWNLSEEKEKEIWAGISTRNGRNWSKSNLEDLK